MERRKRNKPNMEVCMIILKDRDLYVNCSCGTKFVAMEGDFQMNMFNNKIFTLCPSCGDAYYVVFTELETEKPEIKGEKIEND
jgi:hypothetical protein